MDYDLNIMQPKQSLNSVLTRMLPELDGIIKTEQPYAVLAQGDTATVFGAALAAFHAQVPFGHIEGRHRTHDLQHHSLKRVTAKWSRASPSGTLHPLRMPPTPCEKKA